MAGAMAGAMASAMADRIEREGKVACLYGASHPYERKGSAYPTRAIDDGVIAGSEARQGDYQIT